MVQGYRFCRPLPADAVPAWLAERLAPAPATLQQA